MRILLANDGFGDAGGVQSYLDAVAGGLRARGHHLRVLHCDPRPAVCTTGSLDGLRQTSVAIEGVDRAMADVVGWRPDVAYSHNMSRLDVERRLLDEVPVVKFMHGYFGTCIGGQKMFGFPAARPCGRRFGAACLALYAPRRCGQLDPIAMARQFQWAREQRALFDRYRGIVVASDHMRGEFVRNGASADRVHVTPLFTTHAARPSLAPADPPSIAFFGRMTTLKGGELLIRAVAEAGWRLKRSLRLTMVGDGPRRAAWEALAARLRVDATFAGWVTGDERWDWLRGASLLAVPSTWPEPFGLVGLEAGALGVPAVAFDVGGIRQWLTPGENGILVPGNPPRAAALAGGIAEALADTARLRALSDGAVRVARDMSLGRHLDRLEAILSGTVDRHAHPAGR